MSASRRHTFLITTLQETPTFYFRELGEIVRIILIYTQTMSLTYIYQRCTTVSVAEFTVEEIPLTFLFNIDSLNSVSTLCSIITQHSCLQENSQNIQRYAPCPTTVVFHCCFNTMGQYHDALLQPNTTALNTMAQYCGALPQPNTAGHYHSPILWALLQPNTAGHYHSPILQGTTTAQYHGALPQCTTKVQYSRALPYQSCRSDPMTKYDCGNYDHRFTQLW